MPLAANFNRTGSSQTSLRQLASAGPPNLSIQQRDAGNGGHPWSVLLNCLPDFPSALSNPCLNLHWESGLSLSGDGD